MFSKLRCIISFLLVTALCACQPLPKPFKPTALNKIANPLLNLPDGGGVSVRQVLGLPKNTGNLLAREMSKALGEWHILATTALGNKQSIILQGTASVQPENNNSISIHVFWRAVSNTGMLLDQQKINLRVAKGQWNANKIGIFRKIALNSANLMATKLKSPTPKETTSIHKKNSIYVWSIDGAPPQTAALLRRYLVFHLKQMSIPVAFELQDETLVLTGEISLRPSGMRRQNILIRWALLGPDGQELGNLKQENEVADGILEIEWPRLARNIAIGAANGLTKLLSEIPN